MANPFTLLATSLSLSTDAFAAALARGTTARAHDPLTTLRVGAVFGAAEGLMALGGWGVAHALGPIIMAVDHWIALGLLSIIGIRMVLEGLGGQDEVDAVPRTFTATIVTAIGTSIDSAAVGVALALSGASAWVALLIGLTSFAMSSLGYAIGPRIGARFGKRAEVAGGLVLITIGVSIFISHVSA